MRGGCGFDSDLVGPAGSLPPDGISGFNNVGERGATLADDRRNAGVLLVILGLEVGVLKGALEGDVGILGVATHEAEGLCARKYSMLRKVVAMDFTHLAPPLPAVHPSAPARHFGCPRATP